MHAVRRTGMDGSGIMVSWHVCKASRDARRNLTDRRMLQYAEITDTIILRSGTRDGGWVHNSYVSRSRARYQGRSVKVPRTVEGLPRTVVRYDTVQHCTLVGARLRGSEFRMMSKFCKNFYGHALYCLAHDS